MINLTGKHIHIVGGSRGIGRATALLAAQAGAKVSITYRSQHEAAQEVVDEIKEIGSEAFACAGDSSAEGIAKELCEASIARMGPIDAVVISSGIFEAAPIEEMSVQFWDRCMAINVRSTYLAVQAAVPSLKNQQGGSIVIYTSTAGQRGSDLYSAYATSKGAQIMFMRSMARELAPHNIRCNCVAPGWTNTDMSKGPIDELGRADVASSIPLGRIGEPDDPAGAAIFLVSDLAKFITGSTITVDGGFDMRG